MGIQDDEEKVVLPSWVIAVIVIAIVVITIIVVFILARYSERKSERYAQLIVNNKVQEAVSVQRERLFNAHPKLV